MEPSVVPQNVNSNLENFLESDSKRCRKNHRPETRYEILSAIAQVMIADFTDGEVEGVSVE
jgi:hypothetical protein